MPNSTGRSSERTRFQAGHPTGEEDYSPVLPRLVAVLAARRAATNTSSCVPFAEASYAVDFMLNQQNLLRMHNRLVKQERLIGMGRMISPQRRIASRKVDLGSTGSSPHAAVPRSRSMRSCDGSDRRRTGHRDVREVRSSQHVDPPQGPVVTADIWAMGQLASWPLWHRISYRNSWRIAIECRFRPVGNSPRKR